jgi:hypothetical protein
VKPGCEAADACGGASDTNEAAARHRVTTDRRPDRNIRERLFGEDVSGAYAKDSFRCNGIFTDRAALDRAVATQVFQRHRDRTRRSESLERVFYRLD